MKRSLIQFRAAVNTSSVGKHVVEVSLKIWKEFVPYKKHQNINKNSIFFIQFMLDNVLREHIIHSYLPAHLQNCKHRLSSNDAMNECNLMGPLSYYLILIVCPKDVRLKGAILRKLRKPLRKHLEKLSSSKSIFFIFFYLFILRINFGTFPNIMERIFTLKLYTIESINVRDYYYECISKWISLLSISVYCPAHSFI